MANSNQLIVEVVGDTRKFELAMSRTQKLAVGAGLVIGQALRTTTSELAKQGAEWGRLGGALNSVVNIDPVGFFRAVRDEVGPTTEALAKLNDVSKLNALIVQAQAAGFKELAANAKEARSQVVAALNKFSDPRLIRDSTSPGAIAAETSGIPLPKPDVAKAAARRRGITADQRNQFFDAGIARRLDRVQDIRSIQGQIRALGEIAALIDKRRAITKDITRRLTLEDEAVAVRRQRRGLIEELQRDADERARKLREAAQKQADAARDSAEKIRQAFADARRKLLDQQKRDGPLTATTSLNADRLLSGLGLGRDAERLLRARLSHFNSAGKALAGSRSAAAGGESINLNIEIEGRAVEHSVTRNQQKRQRANPPKRRGG